jgi:hypothetical protein
MAQYMTDAGILRVLSLLEADITHMAVQNGAAPTTASTLLNGEFARTDVIDPLVDGFTLVVEGFFDETQANGTITGFGAFGNGATDTSGTGTLIAATDANFTKTSGEESLTISAEITVRRVST